MTRNIFYRKFFVLEKKKCFLVIFYNKNKNKKKKATHITWMLLKIVFAVFEITLRKHIK